MQPKILFFTLILIFIFGCTQIQETQDLTECKNHYTVSCQSEQQNTGNIPCRTDDDCSVENMRSYCKPDGPMLIKCKDAKYYCEDGLCKGCDCPPTATDEIEPLISDSVRIGNAIDEAKQAGEDTTDLENRLSAIDKQLKDLLVNDIKKNGMATLQKEISRLKNDKRILKRIITTGAVSKQPVETPWCNGADINEDGFVGGDDLTIILTNWGKSVTLHTDGDANSDGFVGGDDYSAVLTYWGQSCTGELDVPYSYLVVHIKRGPEEDYPNEFNDWLKPLVETADSYNVKLTLQFSPQWVDYLLKNGDKENIVHSWQENGHEISIIHPGPSHLSWDGYSNMPEQDAISISYIRGTSPDDIHEFLGTMDDFLVMANQLAYPEEIKSGTITNKWTDVPNIPYITSGGGSRNRKAVKQTWNSNVVYTLGIAGLWTSRMLETAQENYETLTKDEIFGVVIHHHNFVGAGKVAIEDWFEYLSYKDSEGIKRKTVTEIMEEYILPNNLIIEDNVCGDSFCDDTERGTRSCSADCRGCVFPSDCAWCTDSSVCPECKDMRVCEQGTPSIFYDFVFGTLSIKPI